MLTFDDGYLDNWAIVWPLLKRYGTKATIFVSSDFIEPDGPARPTLEDVWSGKIESAALGIAGFLRPSEMRAMVDSGLVEFSRTPAHILGCLLAIAWLTFTNPGSTASIRGWRGMPVPSASPSI